MNNFDRIVKQALAKMAQERDPRKKIVEEIRIVVVDGDLVRKMNIEFTMGGHHYRYKFIPENEIWIDESLTKSLEFFSTVAHELVERDLMKNLGYTYEQAHEIASAMERLVYETNPKKNRSEKLSALGLSEKIPKPPSPKSPSKL